MASASYLRLTKSETRELSDREYYTRRMGQPTDWQVKNSSLFTMFVVGAALITVIALLAR